MPYLSISPMYKSYSFQKFKPESMYYPSVKHTLINKMIFNSISTHKTLYN